MAAPADVESLSRRIEALEAQIKALLQVVQLSGSNVTIGAAGKLTLSASLAIDVATTGGLSLTTRNALVIDANALSASVYRDITLNGRNSRIVQERGGDVVIDGKDITLKASGKISAKGTGDVQLRGSKIGQN